MKLEHKNILDGIQDALHEAIFENNRYADKVLERKLKANRKWGSKDRQLVSEVFYNIIRWKRTLEFYMNEEATPDNLYKLILTYLTLNKKPYGTFDEFKKHRPETIKKRFNMPFPSLAIEHSIPDWMAETFERELGPMWSREMRAMNQQAPTVLRINTLKTKKKDLIEALAEEGIKAFSIENYPDALELEYKRNVFISMLFKNGHFEVQDANSQRVADYMDLKPGLRVIDACAGAGGKTLHMAAKMQNKGQIVALDIFEWKLAELKRRAKRAGAHNVEVRTIDDNKVIKRLHNKADRILIDAPCSGLGVLKRNPDAKWKLQPEFLDRIREEQKNILQDYAKMLKVDGLMVYATCSILPSENQEQVSNFINNNPNFKVLDMQTLYPSNGFDGFFMAKIQRIS
jgi:16S rRNA (cytosine967-C5)-methyltransferase